MTEKKKMLVQAAESLGFDEDKLFKVLNATAFNTKTPLTIEQFQMMIHMVKKFDLDPFSKEIYAMPTKGGGVLPIISVDGWIKLAQRHPQFGGYVFSYGPDIEVDGQKGHEWIEVSIKRKDYDDPVVVREYLEEVYVPAFTHKDGGKKKGPWQTHTRRFHRHKTTIQGLRYAFGFGGAYDEDEAVRISNGEKIEKEVVSIDADDYTQEVSQDDLKQSIEHHVTFDFNQETGEVVDHEEVKEEA